MWQARAPPPTRPGAIGHIDALLDRKETPVWAAPLQGAEANMRAAVAYLQDSLKARELMDYELAASRALTYLEVARGRPTETGVLGGLEGALANTVLGVPAGATQADGCAPRPPPRPTARMTVRSPGCACRAARDARAGESPGRNRHRGAERHDRAAHRRGETGGRRLPSR